MQPPILFPPTKRTDDVDFAKALRDYISTTYHEDPDAYSSEIGTLNRLRQDARGAVKDITGRDALYQYYGQLEFLDLHFPIDEKHIRILFTWYDAFSHARASQYSVSYEKACVVFNLGTVCAAIATHHRSKFGGNQLTLPSGNSSSSSAITTAQEDSLRTAFNYLQASAGLYQHINENFLHAPSSDLSRDSVKALVDLMLAQAQEVFLERALFEKKSDGIVSKLAAHASFAYSIVLQSFAADSVRSQFEKAWNDIMKIKIKYFDAMANYHRGLQCEKEYQCGEAVAYLSRAETLAQEAHKFATIFHSSFSTFSTTTAYILGSPPLTSSINSGLSSPSAHTAFLSSTAITIATASSMLEWTRHIVNMISDHKLAAVKDNEVIYHSTVPSLDSLPAVEKHSVARTIPFADICANGKQDTMRIIGTDMFARLVPISVHKAASVYSGEKDRVLKIEKDAIGLADGELEAALNSLELIAVLERVRKFARGGGAKALDPISRNEGGRVIMDPIFAPPAEVLEVWAPAARDEEARRGANSDEMVGHLEGLKVKATECVEEIVKLLDQEQSESERMRIQYMNRWTLEPSATLTSHIRQEVRQHRESLAQVSSSSQIAVTNLNSVHREIAILKKSNEDIETYFVDRVVGDKSIEKKVTDDSLIGLGTLGEQIILEKIENMLNRVQSLKIERAALLGELVEKDDISHSLLVKKDKESHIFQSELAKFKPLQAKIQGNIENSSRTLVGLTNEFFKLRETSKAMKIIDERRNRRSEIVREWKRAFEIWRDSRQGIEKAKQFYLDLMDIVSSLRNTVVGFVNRRTDERQALEAKLASEVRHIVSQSHEVLTDQIARLSLGSLSPTPLPNLPGATIANLEPSVLKLTLGVGTVNASSDSQPSTPKTANDDSATADRRNSISSQLSMSERSAAELNRQPAQSSSSIPPRSEVHQPITSQPPPQYIDTAPNQASQHVQQKYGPYQHEQAVTSQVMSPIPQASAPIGVPSTPPGYARQLPVQPFAPPAPRLSSQYLVASSTGSYPSGQQGYQPRPPPPQQQGHLSIGLPPSGSHVPYQQQNQGPPTSLGAITAGPQSQQQGHTAPYQQQQQQQENQGPSPFFRSGEAPGGPYPPHQQHPAQNVFSPAGRLAGPQGGFQLPHPQQGCSPSTSGVSPTVLSQQQEKGAYLGSQGGYLQQQAWSQGKSGADGPLSSTASIQNSHSSGYPAGPPRQQDITQSIRGQQPLTQSQLAPNGVPGYGSAPPSSPLTGPIHAQAYGNGPTSHSPGHQQVRPPSQQPPTTPFGGHGEYGGQQTLGRYGGPPPPIPPHPSLAHSQAPPPLPPKIMSSKPDHGGVSYIPPPPPMTGAPLPPGAYRAQQTYSRPPNPGGPNDIRQPYGYNQQHTSLGPQPPRPIADSGYPGYRNDQEISSPQQQQQKQYTQQSPQGGWNRQPPQPEQQTGGSSRPEQASHPSMPYQSLQQNAPDRLSQYQHQEQPSPSSGKGSLGTHLPLPQEAGYSGGPSPIQNHQGYAESTNGRSPSQPTHLSQQGHALSHGAPYGQPSHQEWHKPERLVYVQPQQTQPQSPHANAAMPPSPASGVVGHPMQRQGSALPPGPPGGGMVGQPGVLGNHGHNQPAQPQQTPQQAMQLQYQQYQQQHQYPYPPPAPASQNGDQKNPMSYPQSPSVQGYSQQQEVKGQPQQPQQSEQALRAPEGYQQQPRAPQNSNPNTQYNPYGPPQPPLSVNPAQSNYAPYPETVGRDPRAFQQGSSSHPNQPYPTQPPSDNYAKTLMQPGPQYPSTSQSGGASEVGATAPPSYNTYPQQQGSPFGQAHQAQQGSHPSAPGAPIQRYPAHQSAQIGQPNFQGSSYGAGSGNK
ncbi:bck1-like resistance to osmotic shock [Dinochytrium kinnereticum]|nr:bck1-like resistance to osmotic shock [Dinochytrium kinnereticum]